MEIITITLCLIGGALVLSYGANLFVESASKTARNFGISPLLIGLTIVSFGTSAPEFAVNITAALQGNVDISLGNVVGSNVFNIVGIIGLCSLITPLFISQQLLKIDIPFMVAASALCWVFGLDGRITTWEAFIFFALFMGYTLLQIKLAHDEKKEIQNEYKGAYGEKGRTLPEMIKLIIGMILLVTGAKFFVNGAVDGAKLLGWSEAVIALTIISIGTSLPEVATSVVATMKGEQDIAVGNVVGSNIFNLCGVLGATGLIANGLQVQEQIKFMDIPFMVVLSATCLPLAFFRQKFERWIGVVFILLYGIYIWHLLSRV